MTKEEFTKGILSAQARYRENTLAEEVIEEIEAIESGLIECNLDD